MFSWRMVKGVVVNSCPQKLLSGLTSWNFAELASEGLSNHIKSFLPKVTLNVLSEDILKETHSLRVSIYTRRNLGKIALQN